MHVIQENDLVSCQGFCLSSLNISEVCGITIVYNEHATVPEEAACNYIAERKKKKPQWKRLLEMR